VRRAVRPRRTLLDGLCWPGRERGARRDPTEAGPGVGTRPR